MLKGKEAKENMPLEQMMTLKALRIRSGLTQEQVSNALGVSRVTIMKWERDASDMPVKYMSQFAKLYKYSLDSIFFGNSVTLSEQIKKGV